MIVLRSFAYVEAGLYRLPPDVRADNQKWMTCVDRSLGRRLDLLMIGLIAANIRTHHLFSSPTLVTLQRIMEERGDVSASDVTTTDRLRVLIRTDATRTESARVLKIFFTCKGSKAQ